MDNEQLAREIVDNRTVMTRRREQHAHRHEGVQEGGNVQERESIGLVVKGDVAGSVEALVGVLTSSQPEQISVTVIHTGVGPVGERDVEIAASAKGM